MKRFGNLWPELISFQNLFHAFLAARRGKARSRAVLGFELDLEPELLKLKRELENSRYRPGEYRQFSIYERKPRIISAAPFRDRVVHHALMRVIEPRIDRSFIPHSYACRRGKGVHRAISQYQHWAKQHAYALKMDIARYFPSIDHPVLKHTVRRKIKDTRVLDLVDKIIDGSPHGERQMYYFPGDDLFSPLERRVGIPIGNLTSQFFANLYLDGLDKFINNALGVQCYLRYVDDMVVLGNNKRELWDVRHAVSEYLEGLRLRLHPNKAHVFKVANGIDLLGYQVFRTRIKLRNDNGHRFARRLRLMAERYHSGRMQWPEINASVQSWIGHAGHAHSEALRESIFQNVYFSRGTGRASAGG